MGAYLPPTQSGAAAAAATAAKLLATIAAASVVTFITVTAAPAPVAGGALLLLLLLYLLLFLIQEAHLLLPEADSCRLGARGGAVAAGACRFVVVTRAARADPVASAEPGSTTRRARRANAAAALVWQSHSRHSPKTVAAAAAALDGAPAGLEAAFRRACTNTFTPQQRLEGVDISLYVAYRRRGHSRLGDSINTRHRRKGTHNLIKRLKELA